MTETSKPRCFDATDLESARQALARVLPVAENDLPWRALEHAHRQLGASPAFAHSVGTALIAAELRGVFTMLLIIAVLIVRPQGLFGREEL